MKIQIAENYKSDNYKSEICKSGFRPKAVVADTKTVDNRLIAWYLRGDWRVKAKPRSKEKTDL